MSKPAPSPSCLMHRLTCCCWKDLSLFLKREGRTKSHPLARKASSPRRSGSRRNDVSLIIMVGAETRNPPPDTATGAATDTATDRLARRAKQGNQVDCSKEVHLTAQISRNQKKKKKLPNTLRKACVWFQAKRPFGNHSQNFSPPGSTRVHTLPKQ